LTLRWRYRISQFFSRLNPAGPADTEAIEAFLSQGQVPLFRSLPVDEQRHALAVLTRLEESGKIELLLAQAALFHDAGKAIRGKSAGPVAPPVRIWHRVALVLLDAVSPELVKRVARDRPDDWRYPLYVLAFHAELGAELAQRAGLEAAAVDLVRLHHTPVRDACLPGEQKAWLVRLQDADRQS